MTLGVIQLRDGDQIPVAKTIPMVAVHLACFAAFFMKFHWSYLIVCLALYWGRMFFVTGGYHRYFSHRSYKTSRAFQFIIALIATSSTQKGVLWWAANHRHHHRYSDTEEDLHSPSFGGFLWSHIGWILSNRYDNTRYELIGDFAGFDSIYVDVEHSSLSLETTSQICIAALEIGIAAFVRVPSIRPEHVSRALDGGALGVIAPHIRSADEAREVVVSAKYPPLGGRSAGGALSLSDAPRGIYNSHGPKDRSGCPIGAQGDWQQRGAGTSCRACE